MAGYILDRISPVKDAPPCPDGCREELQDTAQRRIALMYPTLT